MNTVKKLLCAPIILLGTLNTNAQLNAGSSGGYLVSNPEINFNVVGCPAEDSTTFDIDCNGIPDLAVSCYKGWSMLDETNTSFLYALNDSVEICGEISSITPKVATFFNFGDPITPPSGATWYSNNRYTLGEYGFWAAPIWTQTNKYIGYRLGSFEGWIKISFNLYDSSDCYVPVTLEINELVKKCMATSINTKHNQEQIQIGPNPANTCLKIYTTLPFTNSSIILYDLAGKQVLELDKLWGEEIIVERNKLRSGCYILKIYTPNALVYTSRVQFID